MIVYTLPNGVLHYNEDRHEYYLNDEKIPGVTSITGDPLANVNVLMRWSAKECAEYVRENIGDINHKDPVAVKELTDEAKRAAFKKRDRLASVGNLVHSFAEAYINHRFLGTEEPHLPENEQAKNSCLAFVDWANRQEIVVHSLEQKVLYTGRDRQLWPFAGTYDADLTLNGVRTLIDWKTSARFSPSMMAQLGGYDIALEEMSPQRFERHMVVRFDRDTGKPDFWSSDAIDLNRKAFHACYKLLKFKEYQKK